MKHLDVLDEKFGADKVLGGLCAIGVTLTTEGHVQHLNKLHKLAFGERNAKTSARIEAIATQFQGSLCDWKASPDILQEMWEKWVFLSSLAGITCLCRSSVGDIMQAGGETTAKAILDEAQSIAQAYGHPARPEAMADNVKQLTLVGAPTTASMLRDIEKKSPIEAEHVIGDLVGRGAAKGLATPILSTALLHLRAYEARRLRDLEKQ
jgi:2-dehydropantoate 2-reductase